MSEKIPNSERIAELWDAMKNYVDSRPGGGSAGAGGVPIGTIVIWSGTTDNIPDGWYLCDGTNGTPDLRGRFVLGSNDAHAVGETGGEEEVTLTVDQMPKHSHEIREAYNINSTTQGYSGGNNFASNVTYSLLSGAFPKVRTSGSSKSHTNMPPYYTLCYIMKI